MGHMTGGDDFTGQLAVTGLIVEKHVGRKGFEKGRLGQAAEEQRLVKTNVPFAQRTNHPLMGRCRSRRDQRGTDRTGVLRELTLQQIESGKKALERPTAQRLASGLALAGLERFQTTSLINALRLIGKQHRVSVEGNA